MNTKGRDREGYIVGSVQKPRASDFTDDTKTSNPPNNFRDERITHYHLDPYQIRFVYSFDSYLKIFLYFFKSLRTRDPFFDDAAHDNKAGLQKSVELYS